MSNGGFKTFVLISSILHLLAFLIIPGSILDWSQPYYEEEEHPDVFWVDYWIEDIKSPATLPDETQEQQEETKVEVDELKIPEPVEDIVEQEAEEKTEEIESPEEKPHTVTEDIAGTTPDEDPLADHDVEESVIPEPETGEEPETSPQPAAEDITIETEEPQEQLITSEDSPEEIYIPEAAAEEEKAEEAQPKEPEDKTEQEQAEPEPVPIVEEPAEESLKLPDDPAQVVIKELVPLHPKDPWNEGLEGRVTLLINVDRAGRLAQIEVLQSSGDIRFDNVAKNTIQIGGWEFMSLDVPYTIKIEFDFRISHPEAELHYLDLTYLEEVR